MNDSGFGVEVDGEVDGFEEDSVLSVIVLSIARALLRIFENALENVVEENAKGAVLCAEKGGSGHFSRVQAAGILTGWRVVL